MYILDLLFFPLYFTKFSLNTVSIRVKFGSSKEKITTRRMYIYLISDTYLLTLTNLETDVRQSLPSTTIM